MFQLSDVRNEEEGHIKRRKLKGMEEKRWGKERLRSRAVGEKRQFEQDKGRIKIKGNEK